MNFYILAFLLLFTVSSSPRPDNRHDAKNETGDPAKIVFKSTDGGQTWQDISKGLPGSLKEDSIRGNLFFANDKGLYLRVGNGLYHNAPEANAPFWTKEISEGGHSLVAPGKPAKFYWGVNLKTASGASVWSPILEDFERPRMGSFFETSGGALFIGTDRGFFKTVDNGKTWKHVYSGGWVGHMAESDGVLLAISIRSIIRSTDNGETWAPTTSEDSMAWDVKPIKGGFVAITSSLERGTRRISTSYDGGKTWQSIHSGLQDKEVIDSIRRTWNVRPAVKAFMTSIIQVGDYFYGMHPYGIFRSSDKGKTWKFLLPSIDDKGFNLFISGNVIYAIRGGGGC